MERPFNPEALPEITGPNIAIANPAFAPAAESAPTTSSIPKRRPAPADDRPSKPATRRRAAVDAAKDLAGRGDRPVAKKGYAGRNKKRDENAPVAMKEEEEDEEDSNDDRSVASGAEEEEEEESDEELPVAAVPKRHTDCCKFMEKGEYSSYPPFLAQSSEYLPLFHALLIAGKSCTSCSAVIHMVCNDSPHCIDYEICMTPGKPKRVKIAPSASISLSHSASSTLFRCFRCHFAAHMPCIAKTLARSRDDYNGVVGAKQYFVKFAGKKIRLTFSWVPDHWLSRVNDGIPDFEEVVAEDMAAVAASKSAAPPPWPKSALDVLPKERRVARKFLLVKFKTGTAKSHCDVLPADPALVDCRPALFEKYLREIELANREYDVARPREYAELTAQPPYIVGGKLRDHQSKKRGSILAEEMGLVTFIATLLSTTSAAPLRSSCRRARFTIGSTSLRDGLLVMVFRGTDEEKAAMRRQELLLPGPFGRKGKVGVRVHVVVTNYEQILSEATIFSRAHFEAIVLDEGYRAKNPETEAYKMVSSLFKSATKVILSGTPVQNCTAELYALLSFIDPQTFKDPHAHDWVTTIGNLTAEHTQTIKQIMDTYTLRRLKSTVETLPPKLEMIVPVTLTKVQKELCKERSKVDSLFKGRILSYRCRVRPGLKRAKRLA
ncbi:SNF2 family N-terminal domain-containing protein [Blyttiomyces helicus]|uniref:SNF2 family N-terminal domain-containing protein n=1 Tax=Blyttiomyces helicus TaxID=388810 RepID=A0A4P9W304_9FUNG|nr:SNF2 family N-terminal domain-containing protein [Blyttiomyces helicus]|eukprot:RKO86651.1 SNF2 family N-terminal domain-containing protein [Blyttiomyces helicus]